MKLLKVGDTVAVRRDICLGHWVEPGSNGIVVRIGNNEGQPIYHVKIEGVQYSFVRSDLYA